MNHDDKAKIDITYCVEWGFFKAAGLAGAINETFGIEAELIEEHDGIYEVALDKNVIYSNQKSCRNVPTIPEILQEIGKHIPPLPGKAMKVTGVLPMTK